MAKIRYLAVLLAVMVIVLLPDASAYDRQTFDFRHDFERSNHTQTDHSLRNETALVGIVNKTMGNETISNNTIANETIELEAESHAVELPNDYSAAPAPAINETETSVDKPQLRNISLENRTKINETTSIQKANATGSVSVNAANTSKAKNASVHSLWFEIELQNSSKNETTAIVIRDSPAQKQNFISRLLKWFSHKG
jgi:hypothetical protein